MRSQAAQFGAVSVLVHLMPSTLQEMKEQPARLRATAQANAAKLYTELGASAWPAGRWSNDVGQVSMYVTAQGLDKLRTTGSAMAFGPWKHWHEAGAHFAPDGSHTEIDAQIARQGFADVEVTLNVEAMEQELHRDGSVRHMAAAQDIRSAARAVRAKLAGLGTRELPQHANTLLAVDAVERDGSDPRVTMRVTAQGLLRLTEDPAIRSLRPAGQVDTRPVHVDVSALDRAKLDGTVDAIIVVRNTHTTGTLSRNSREALANSNRRAMTAALAEVGAAQSIRKDYAQFGAASVQLTAAQLTQLRDGGDRRVLAILENKPVATVQLATSNQSMNMAWATSRNFRAAGQSILVFDSGSQIDHPFYNGRVAYQGCFGTNATVGTSQYVSICPAPDAAGDSPGNWPGAGAPAVDRAPPGGRLCSAFPATCVHGTHVAGTTSGRQGAGVPVGLQGTAPDSNVMPIQVLSYDNNNLAQPQVFAADLIASLNAAANFLLGRPPQDTPFTLNLSLGGGRNVAPCNGAANTAYVSAIQAIRLAGAPVVISSGNDAYDDAIGFPACLPGAIKVTALANNLNANARGFFSPTQGANVASPAAFGVDFFAAPGGGNDTFVTSSASPGYGTQWLGMAGTSQAAPQMAGLYATYKAVNPTHTVDQATAWLRSPTNTVAVPMTSRAGTALGFSILRPRLNLGQP